MPTAPVLKDTNAVNSLGDGPGARRVRTCAATCSTSPPTKEAQVVYRMAAIYGQVVNHTAVVPRVLAQVGGLEEADGRLLDRSPLLDPPFQRGQRRNVPALKADGGKTGVLLRKVGEHLRLVRRHAQRFLHEQMPPLLQHGTGRRKEVLGRHDDVHGMRINFLQHPLVVGIDARNAKALGGGLCFLDKQVARRRQVYVGQAGDGGIVYAVGQAAGTDKGHPYFVCHESRPFLTLSR